MIGKPWRDMSASETQPGDVYTVNDGCVNVVELYVDYHRKDHWIRFGMGTVYKIDYVHYLYRPQRKTKTAMRREAQTMLDVLRAGGVEVADEVMWVNWEKLK